MHVHSEYSEYQGGVEHRARDKHGDGAVQVRKVVAGDPPYDCYTIHNRELQLAGQVRRKGPEYIRRLTE